MEAEPEPEEVEEAGDEVTDVSLVVSWNWKVRAANGLWCESFVHDCLKAFTASP